MVLVSVLVHSWHLPKLPNTLAHFKYTKYLHKIAQIFFITVQSNNKLIYTISWVKSFDAFSQTNITLNFHSV